MQGGEELTDPAEVVLRFCNLLSERDAEAARSHLAADAVYQNVGMAASIGADAIVADLANQFTMFPQTYRFEMKHVAVNGDLVLTERVDYLEGPGMKMALPVMGTFVVKDGLIARWTDYFDSALIGKILGGEDVEDLIPSGY
jgi:limonene-1,2-epoxide hydrolase